MRVKLLISYDGTEYHGWQSQNNETSVQETVICAIKIITGEDVTLVGSGRTDAGVHAEGQVASFETSANIPAKNFARALNTVLPPDIKILESQSVDSNFNARRDAKKKTYRYSVYLSSIDMPLKERYAHKVYGELDVEKMISASKLFIGEHDFKAFSSTGSQVKTTVRTIYDLSIEKRGIDLFITVSGSGFLYNMVRIIAGALIKIGKGSITEKDIKKMLESGNKIDNLTTLPAKGLSLISVEY